jgi:hypothetical protein
MISYNNETRRLVSTFLTYRNEVDIYTEDEDKDKEFYNVLFNKLLSDNITINDITPLGSKENVIEHCKNDNSTNRKKVYIVDGDIAIINNENIQLDNLFVLNRYCIENFLFNENSICKYLYLNCGIKSELTIKEELKYEELLSSYNKHLIELFFHFSIIDSNGGKFKLFNANKYHSKIGQELTFNTTLVNDDIITLKNEIIELVDEDEYMNQLSILREKWVYSSDNLIKIISGKDYLIPIILFKSQFFKQSKAMPSLEEIKISLVQNINTDDLSELKEFIMK